MEKDRQEKVQEILDITDKDVEHKGCGTGRDLPWLHGGKDMQKHLDGVDSNTK
jgi:hypothetical protein